MTAAELKALIDSGLAPLVLDVREAWELEHAPYPFPVTHIPLAELPRRYQELPGDQTIICACRSGGRSSQAAFFLMRKGFTVTNLEGGILACSAAPW